MKYGLPLLLLIFGCLTGFCQHPHGRISKARFYGPRDVDFVVFCAKKLEYPLELRNQSKKDSAHWAGVYFSINVQGQIDSIYTFTSSSPAAENELKRVVLGSIPSNSIPTIRVLHMPLIQR